MSKPPTPDQEALANGLVHLRAKIRLASRKDLHGEFFPYGNAYSELISFVYQECFEHAKRLDELASHTVLHTTAEWNRAANLTTGIYCTLDGCAEQMDEALLMRMLEAADALAMSAIEIVLPLVGGEVAHV